MKWMIISDIHGSYDDLKKVMEIYEEEKMENMCKRNVLLPAMPEQAGVMHQKIHAGSV